MSQSVKYNAVVTVLGKDRVGIIAGVTAVLAKLNINISDISQTILKDMFTMIMLVDTIKSTYTFENIREELKVLGQEMNLEIRIQHKDIFNAMQRI
ncbi:MAG TPA: ACT domain-containing protein [Clostridiaceae bacterium]|jgi:ACT domain-containing protein|nr:ACT domain-containing protein [Clostridiaceae bacterium]